VSTYALPVCAFRGAHDHVTRGRAAIRSVKTHAVD
jgi:hypothetical protein